MNNLGAARPLALVGQVAQSERPAWAQEVLVGDCTPAFSTQNGVLFRGDCLDVMKLVKDEAVDTVFADPPFNLNKFYGARVNDNKSDSEYIAWCKLWLNESVRVLKPGGSLFVYNIPKWNMLLGAYLYEKGLEFRHSVAISMKAGLPIPRRLYPCHYSLLYFSKGKPKSFRKIRTPIETCRHCGKEIKDFGGHRDAMNPKGVNLSDMWLDISPVRHWKFKSPKRKANQLSTKILERVVEISTSPGDVVLDPFGGSGTTYAVCESRSRRWIGMEIETLEVIIERLALPAQHRHPNFDYIED